MPSVTADDTGRVIIVDRPGSVQTQLLIGRVGADRHDRVWPAQVLGTYCLGGTLTSRLDRVLREEKGYTYGVRAFGQVLRAAPDGSGIAMLAISGSVDTPNTGPALDDLWTVLRTLAAEGLTDAERLDSALSAGILSAEEAAALQLFWRLRHACIMVDDFPADVGRAASARTEQVQSFEAVRKTA